MNTHMLSQTHIHTHPQWLAAGVATSCLFLYCGYRWRRHFFLFFLFFFHWRSRLVFISITQRHVKSTIVVECSSLCSVCQPAVSHFLFLLFSALASGLMRGAKVWTVQPYRVLVQVCESCNPPPPPPTPVSCSLQAPLVWLLSMNLSAIVCVCRPSRQTAGCCRKWVQILGFAG